MEPFVYLKDVVTLQVKPDLCTGCGICLDVCPHEVIGSGRQARPHCESRWLYGMRCLQPELSRRRHCRRRGCGMRRRSDQRHAQPSRRRVLLYHRHEKSVRRQGRGNLLRLSNKSRTGIVQKKLFPRSFLCVILSTALESALLGLFKNAHMQGARNPRSETYSFIR